MPKIQSFTKELQFHHWFLIHAFQRLFYRHYSSIHSKFFLPSWFTSSEVTTITANKHTSRSHNLQLIKTNFHSATGHKWIRGTWRWKLDWVFTVTVTSVIVFCFYIMLKSTKQFSSGRHLCDDKFQIEGALMPKGFSRQQKCRPRYR